MRDSSRPDLADLIDRNLNVRDDDRVYDRNDVMTLFDLYAKGSIDESSFENDFYLMYTRDGAINISGAEKSVLDDLGEVIHRFSPFEEDHVAAPGAFTTREQARDAIIGAKNKLDGVSGL